MSTNVLTPAVAGCFHMAPAPIAAHSTLPLRPFLLDSSAMEIPIGEYRLREWR